jgi:hypothetical protein
MSVAFRIIRAVLNRAVMKRKRASGGIPFSIIFNIVYFPYFIEACAAASLAIGTLNGEQLT